MLKFDTPEQVVEEAERIRRATYWQSVRSMVEDAWSAHPGDEDAQHDYLKQSVDGSSWLIHTNETFEVLRFTRNDSAYREAGADVPTDGDAFTIYEFIAFYALRQDVLDELAEIREKRRIEPGSIDRKSVV